MEGLRFLHPGVVPLCAVNENPYIFEMAADENLGDAVHSAKAICRACPYLDPCRTFALATHQTWGVWGGMSWQQRRAWHKRRYALKALKLQQRSE